MPRRRSNRRRRPEAANNRGWRLRLSRIKWNILLNICALLGVSGLALFATAWLLDRPIDSVRVEGTFERVSAVQVEAAMAPFIEQGFLRLDLADVRRSVEALPWVERARIRRAWPAALHVELHEQQAAARWGDAGLLNVHGELFVTDVTHIPAELPRLHGPDGTERVVAQRFFALNARLQQRGLTATELVLDERGAWELVLGDGMRVRFGTSGVDARAERFFVALDRVLAPLTGRINYVDMRYPNGFAVGWKSGMRVSGSDAAGDAHAG